ncbi:hypothetical protein EJ04DRAFT_118 [Polyplosphaeria fusca]|uniref:Uncharacterized protein n=1 Tax=Polyplosphaeria fusca TaxID=682080 RepID=A0A9P4V7S2_9PLEO|nr:hypothetical protein EJ04DRAFT_118 [Polyplosphaeria fusca]
MVWSANLPAFFTRSSHAQRGDPQQSPGARSFWLNMPWSDSQPKDNVSPSDHVYSQLANRHCQWCLQKYGILQLQHSANIIRYDPPRPPFSQSFPCKATHSSRNAYRGSPVGLLASPQRPCHRIRPSLTPASQPDKLAPSLLRALA